MIESGYYPAGAEFDPSAPYNQSDPGDMEFGVTCSQSLSKSVSVWTSDYIPGSSGVDYEVNDEGGVDTISWEDDPDTSDTDWEKAYEEDHYTPLQLINLFKRYLESELNHTETVSKQPSFLKHLISECSDWVEDETEIIED